MLEPTNHFYPVLLIAAAAIALAGCGGKDAVAPVDVEKQAFADLRAEVREAIDDPTHEAKVLEVVENLSTDLAVLRESVSKRNKRTRQLNADYDTPRSDFEEFFDQVYTEIRANQVRVAESHRVLREVTTAQEWAQISKARTKAMSASINTIRTD